MEKLLIYIGSVVIFLWGVAHIIPVKPVVNGFGQISIDNKRIIVMEWISEGLTLCFIGFLGAIVTFTGGTGNLVSIITIRSIAGMLIIMAILTLLTGGKTSIVPIKICPAIKVSCAVLLFLGTL